MESPLVIRIDKNEFKPGRSITQDGGAGERIRYPLTNLDAISKGVLRLLFTIQFYRFTVSKPQKFFIPINDVTDVTDSESIKPV